jgi:hypothetical protein
MPVTALHRTPHPVHGQHDGVQLGIKGVQPKVPRQIGKRGVHTGPTVNSCWPFDQAVQALP